MAEASWVVMKFGGTSVSSAELWSRIAEQARAHRSRGHRVMVVVSALRGVTDALQDYVDRADPRRFEGLLEQLRARHDSLLAELGLPATLLDGCYERLAKLARVEEAMLAEPACQASILCQGELLSSTLGAAALAKLGVPAQWQDARELLRGEAPPHSGPRSRYLSVHCDSSADRELAERLGRAGELHITQGFLAANEDGETVLLGRGGSDTSAACLAGRLDALRLEIWSDMPGMFTANPRLIPGARLLQLLSYREAQELASMGARMLHPRCIAPLRERGIPLHIRQTSRPDIAGTEISNHARDFGAQVKAILHRKGITLIALESISMWHQVGFLADAFAVFKRHGLSVDLVSTSEANVTVSLDLEAQLLDPEHLEPVVAELERICQVEVLHGCASVSLVGLGIRTILHRLGPALEVFEQRHIHLVSQASNDLNLTFVVDEGDADKLVQQLHRNLIPGGVGGDSVFGPTWEQLFRAGPAVAERAPWWKTLREPLLECMQGRDAAYVYHLDSIREAGRRLQALEQVDRLFYAMKANPNPEILRALAAEGLGIECVSLQEIRAVLDAVPEMSPDRILFTPNFAARPEYRAALELGVHLTVDNLFLFEHWGEDFRGRELIVRLDPGSGLGHHKMVRTAGINAKFGVPLARLDELRQWVEELQLRIVGFHAHTGSGILHADAWHRTLQVLSDAGRDFPDLRFIDIGGGLGVPDKPDELPFDLESLDRGLAEVKAQLGRDLEIWLEPGRYLVAEAGVLLARVTQTKGKGEVQYVGVATGMNSLIRPALYGAYHEIVNLSRLEEHADRICNIVGPICETGDILGTDRLLPSCREGDLLLLANAGAYGAAMASRYNLREPAEELVI